MDSLRKTLRGDISLTHNISKHSDCSSTCKSFAEEIPERRKGQRRNRSNWWEMAVSQRKAYMNKGEETMERRSIMFSFFFGKNTFPVV